MGEWTQMIFSYCVVRKRSQDLLFDMDEDDDVFCNVPPGVEKIAYDLAKDKVVRVDIKTAPNCNMQDRSCQSEAQTRRACQ